MTGPGRDPEQDAVRRLLAEARHDEPMPDDVRARLDHVLAGLTAERHEVRSTEPVVDLAARRRRRRRTSLLAAAAIVVAGVGIGQMVDTTGGSDSVSGESTAAQDSSGGAEERAEDSQAESVEPYAQSDSPSLGAWTDATLPRVRSTHLRADLRRALSPLTAARERVQDMYDDPTCAAPSVSSSGEQVRITLDDDPATAVVLSRSGGRHVVGIYSCLDGAEIQTVRLGVR